jgi:hypothetical protein
VAILRDRFPESPGAALRRAESLRFDEVNRQITRMRTRLNLGLITEAHFQGEAKALIESLEGWAPPEPQDARPPGFRYRSFIGQRRTPADPRPPADATAPRVNDEPSAPTR